MTPPRTDTRPANEFDRLVDRMKHEAKPGQSPVAMAIGAAMALGMPSFQGLIPATASQKTKTIEGAKP